VFRAADTKDPFTFGFLSANVTCHPETGKPFRLLITSQVFGYCASEISGDAIANQEADKVAQAAQVECGLGTFAVTYRYVDSSSSRDAADTRLFNARQSSNVQKFGTIYASESRYSTKCQ
jgi:hypothetical protein